MEANAEYMGINMKTLQLSIVFLTSVYILECKKSHKKTYLIETADDDEYEGAGNEEYPLPRQDYWQSPATPPWSHVTPPTTTPPAKAWPPVTTTPPAPAWPDTEPPKAWDYGYHGASSYKKPGTYGSKKPHTYGSNKPKKYGGGSKYGGGEDYNRGLSGIFYTT